MSAQGKKYSSQWAAQFYVCAELSRRGYLVSIPLGNAKFTDIHVETESGHDFRIDVKSLINKGNNYIFKRIEPFKDKFYVLALLPPDSSAPSFFILPSKDLMAIRDDFQKEVETKGRNWNDPMAGVYIRHVEKYKDRWDLLPK